MFISLLCVGFIYGVCKYVGFWVIFYEFFIYRFVIGISNLYFLWVFLINFNVRGLFYKFYLEKYWFMGIWVKLVFRLIYCDKCLG